MILLLFYLFLCFVVAMLGRKTILGFWPNFLFSIFLTPLIPLIYVLIIGERPKKSQVPTAK